jgi:hypothetical protein
MRSITSQRYEISVLLLFFQDAWIASELKEVAVVEV